ncbi:zona pellucida protein C [Gadus chalcogrammus]|uniref:zona pellucida protein C n=1 Tax=Gadus chalcogrammus TaxID=1042646 RepID=UPI0024C34E10|nr:zona pellucida protein C [Gadus chalcogrammus]
MMLMLGVFLLCFGTGTLLPFHSTLESQIAELSQGIFEDAFLFPADMDFQGPFDTMFSSWQSSRPDFHMLTELPPFMSLPNVQVLCNRSQITLLVDRAYGGVQLNGDEVQLGKGCNVNGVLDNQFVLTHDHTKCGTIRVVQSGLEVFSNYLHVDPKKSVFNWWPTPFTLPISCSPNMRPSSSFPFPLELPNEEWSFVMQPMNSFWTQTAQSNFYERGQNINVQVMAKSGVRQQPFLQACFVSPSPDPHFKPRQAVVINKGCASVSSDSSPALVEYAAPTSEGAINLVLHTSTLHSEVYMHCSVLMSAFGITPGSKSCNYNKMESRWEELSGDLEVCRCCSSRCQAVKHLNIATKAIVTTGPFYFVGEEMAEAPLTSLDHLGDSSLSSGAEAMQSDAAFAVVTEYQAPSAPSLQDSRVQSEVNEIAETPMDPPLGEPRGMVVQSLGPVARLTMWLPRGLRTTQPLPEPERTPSMPNASEAPDSGLNEIQINPRATGEDLLLLPGSDKSDGKDASSDADMGTPAMVDGHPIPEASEKTSLLEESKRKRWGWRPMVTGDFKGLVNVNNLSEEKRPEKRSNRRRDQRDASSSSPVIRSRVQFTKSVDGSQTLSYEEDVIKQKEKPKMRSLGKDDVVKGIQKTGQRALYTFLELLKNIRAE